MWFSMYLLCQKNVVTLQPKYKNQNTLWPEFVGQLTKKKCINGKREKHYTNRYKKQESRV